MSERLALWLAELHERFRSENRASGEGLESTVYSTLAWPSWFPALLALAGLVWFAWLYRQERGNLQAWQRTFPGPARRRGRRCTS